MVTDTRDEVWREAAPSARSNSRSSVRCALTAGLFGKHRFDFRLQQLRVQRELITLHQRPGSRAYLDLVDLHKITVAEEFDVVVEDTGEQHGLMDGMQGAINLPQGAQGGTGALDAFELARGMESLFSSALTLAFEALSLFAGLRSADFQLAGAGETQALHAAALGEHAVHRQT